MDIVKGTDIKLKITALKDAEGTPIQMDSIFLIFTVKDNFGHTYTAVYDPEGEKSVNTYWDGINLYVALENYCLKGEISLQVATQTEDPAFADGQWTTIGKCRKLGINIIEC